jgi:fructokinase
MLAALMRRGVTSRLALEGLAGQELEASLRYAAAVSGLTCTRAGADPPTTREVELFLQAAE